MDIYGRSLASISTKLILNLCNFYIWNDVKPWKRRELGSPSQNLIEILISICIVCNDFHLNPKPTCTTCFKHFELYIYRIIVILTLLNSSWNFTSFGDGLVQFWVILAKYQVFEAKLSFYSWFLDRDLLL